MKPRKTLERTAEALARLVASPAGRSRRWADNRAPSHPSQSKSPFALASGITAIAGPVAFAVAYAVLVFAAYVISHRGTGAGSDPVAFALLAFEAVLTARAAWILLTVLGLVCGVISLARRERHRRLAIVSTAMHALQLLAVATKVAVATQHGGF